MALTVDITDSADVPLEQAGAFAWVAEAAGFDGVGMPDHQGSGRDVFLRLAIAAGQTSRITLFSAVTNPVTRHPSVLASLARSLGELAPGRFRLALGAGDNAVRFIGQRPATIATMREAVVTIRGLLAGEEVAMGEGTVGRLGHPSTERVAVSINGSSPRTLELAGEVADQAYPMVGIGPAMVGAARRAIEAGAARSSRTPRDVPMTLGVPAFVDESTDRARARARPILYNWLRRPERIFRREVEAMGYELPPLRSADDIPDEWIEPFCDMMGLVGTAEHCADRLVRLVEESGVDHVVCQLYGAKGPDVDIAIRAFEKTILPRVK